MKKETYTIQDVISLITSLPFQKFSHPYFSDDEYIYGDGQGHLCDEKGYQLPQGEFWNLRMNTMKDGWFMVEEKSNVVHCDKDDSKDCISNSNTTDMTEAEIQELYKNAKDIIRKMPDKIIKVSKFNIYQPDIFDRDEHRERIDYVQLIKNKLVFMSESIVNGQPWVAYLSHLDAELRREVLKHIIKTYGKQN